MSVVQRCPNCGTTRASSGECEACHEAEVRYFCTNHAPGRWLDTDTCSDCGARFGDPPPATASAAPAVPRRNRAASPSRPPPSRPPPSSSAPAPRYTRASRPSIGAGAWISSKPSAPESEAERGLGASPRLAPWQRLLLAAVRARYTPTRLSRARERPVIGRSLGGCLQRLLLVVVLVFVAIAGAAFFFGQALLNGY